jgi:hypothetical protein
MYRKRSEDADAARSTLTGACAGSARLEAIDATINSEQRWERESAGMERFLEMADESCSLGKIPLHSRERKSTG